MAQSTEFATLSPYANTIASIDPDVNPVGVEASMRLQYGTLDHLSRDTFAQEIEIAKGCEAEEPGFMRSTAESYGMADAFDAAQAILARTHASSDAPKNNHTAHTPLRVRSGNSEHHRWRDAINTAKTKRDDATRAIANARTTGERLSAEDALRVANEMLDRARYELDALGPDKT